MFYDSDSPVNPIKAVECEIWKQNIFITAFSDLIVTKYTQNKRGEIMVVFFIILLFSYTSNQTV